MENANEIIDMVITKIKILEQENKQLKEQLAIRDKALELACEKISNTEKNITFNFCYNFYLEQAKESMK